MEINYKNFKKRDEVKQYLNSLGFGDARAFLLMNALEDGLDIDLIAIQDLQYGQMRVVIDGLKAGYYILDYCNSSYGVASMWLIYQLLIHDMAVPSDIPKDLSMFVASAIFEATQLGFPCEIFIKNHEVAKHSSVLFDYFKRGITLENLDWITSDMSSEFVSNIIDMKLINRFIPEMLQMSEAELTKCCAQINEDEKLGKIYNDAFLKKFKIFKNMQLT